MLTLGLIPRVRPILASVLGFEVGVETGMKIWPRCIPCILFIRAREIEKLIPDREQGLSIMAEIAKIMEMYVNVDSNVTEVSTKAWRLLKRLTGVEDPYAEEKRKAILEALKLEPEIDKMLSQYSGFERFKLAVKAALAGNTIDAGVVEHNPDELITVDTIKELRIARENLKDLYRMAMSGATIVYLLDNAGEAVFDKILMRELKSLGATVIAVAKGGPFQNDATLQDAIMAGVDSVADRLISTGTDAASIFLDEISDEVREALEIADVVIAKGMAHYEYVSELKLGKPIFFMLRAKCEPVARELRVEKGEYVAFMLKP